MDALVGRWTIRLKVPGVGAAWTEFSWQDGNAHLRQVSADLAGGARVLPALHRHDERGWDTVDARWEMSEDGVTWRVDFELTYP